MGGVVFEEALLEIEVCFVGLADEFLGDGQEVDRQLTLQGGAGGGFFAMAPRKIPKKFPLLGRCERLQSSSGGQPRFTNIATLHVSQE